MVGFSFFSLLSHRKTGEVLASGKDRGYFYVILKAPTQDLQGCLLGESLLLVMTKWYYTVLKISGIYVLSAQSCPCFRLCQAKSHGRPFRTDVKPLVTKFVRMKMNYRDFFVVGPFVKWQSCSGCGWFVVHLPGPHELGGTWGARLELRKRVMLLVCRRDVTAQIF